MTKEQEEKLNAQEKFMLIIEIMRVRGVKKRLEILADYLVRNMEINKDELLELLYVIIEDAKGGAPVKNKKDIDIGIKNNIDKEMN